MDDPLVNDLSIIRLHSPDDRTFSLTIPVGNTIIKVLYCCEACEMPEITKQEVLQC